MTPHLETLESVGQDIDEARAKIVVTRESLQAVLDRDIDVPEFRQAIARLERIEAELTRMAREGLA
jgi:hypothetical protein